MIRSGSIIVLILMVIMGVMAGCTRQSGEKKPAEDSRDNKPPAELKSLGTELDTLIAELDKKIKARSGGAMQQSIRLNPPGDASGGENRAGQGPSGQYSAGQQQPEQKPGNQSSSNRPQDKKNQGEDSGQEGQSPGGQSQSPAGPLKPQTGQTNRPSGDDGGQSAGAGSDWQKEFTSMRRIHQSWNSLMPDAIGAGMGTEARSQFSAALEQLTRAVTARQSDVSMSAALELYRHYSDLARLFSDAVPPEFYRLKYEIMAAVYESSQKNWEKAEEHIPRLQEQWLYLGAQAKDTDAKTLSRAEFAIMDLQNAVKSRQVDLVMIKGEIAMMNLNHLQTKISAPSGGQGQPSGQGHSSGQGGGGSYGKSGS